MTNDRAVLAEAELTHLREENESLREKLEEMSRGYINARTQIARLRRVEEAAREAETVLTAMLAADWPIERLAPRLTRLQAIVRAALANPPTEYDPKDFNPLTGKRLADQPTDASVGWDHSDGQTS